MPKYRKRLKLSEVIGIFGCSRNTFITRCRTGQYDIKLIQENPGSRQPVLVFKGEVDQEARRLGILV